VNYINLISQKSGIWLDWKLRSFHTTPSFSFTLLFFYSCLIKNKYLYPHSLSCCLLSTAPLLSYDSACSRKNTGFKFLLVDQPVHQDETRCIIKSWKASVFFKSEIQSNKRGGTESNTREEILQVWM